MGFDKQRLRKRVYIRDRGECVNCQDDLDFSDRHNTTLHHVIPKSKGGEWGMANIALCCRTCNQNFADYWPPLWLVWEMAERMRRWRNRPKSTDGVLEVATALV